MVRPMNLTGVDLFSGGGGASLGLKRIDGVSIVGAADFDDEVREYYNKNLPVDAVGIDLTKDDAFNRFIDSYDITPGDIEFVIGCPPCQAFSSLQDTTPDTDDEPIDRQLQAYLDFMLKAAPKVVVFENVPGLITDEYGQYLDNLKHYLRKAGYGFKVNVLKTAHYGVPQTRKRTIGFGVNGASSDDVVFPEPTHLPKDHPNYDDNVDPLVTVRDAIGDLPPLEAGETYEGGDFNGHVASNHRSSTVERIRNVPKDGGSRSDLPEENQLACHQQLVDGGAGSSYGRMAWDELGPTLTTRCTTPSSGRFVHPEQHRGITPREAARIMTFPDSYELPEKTSLAEQLIGNAVPPRFIERVVRGLLQENEHLITG